MRACVRVCVCVYPRARVGEVRLQISQNVKTFLNCLDTFIPRNRSAYRLALTGFKYMPHLNVNWKQILCFATVTFKNKTDYVFFAGLFCVIDKTGHLIFKVGDVMI